ncbi:MAG: hypothetical protein AB7O57_18820 [Hyphomicrobiaceae bacterium]
MSLLTSICADEIRQRGNIREADVTRLRAACEAADGITAEDAEGLFSLHAATPIQHPAWGPFLVEAITDYIVHQARPEGYVVAENARWLIDRVSTFGRIETTSELALLVHVLETARWTPPSLAAFGLEQIRHAVESAAGPLRAGRDIGAGCLTQDDVGLAARIVAAFGGETSLALTRAEADVLLSINRAIAPGASSPAWSALFITTIGAAVLAAMGHAVAPRRDLAASATSGVDTPELVAMILGHEHGLASHTSGRSGERIHVAPRVWRSASVLTPEERALARLERQRLEIVTNEVIEEANDGWLMERLADGDPADANERGLLAYILREATRHSPELVRFAACRAAAA